MAFKKSIVGGTFDNFHKGHEALLKQACDLSDLVLVGISSDVFAKRFKTGKVESFEKRRANVEDFLKRLGGRYMIVEINDFYGPSTTDHDIEAIFVSEETSLRAKEINAVRLKKGLKKLVIVEVPFVLAADGEPISSERIRRGEIDNTGRCI